MTKIMTMSMMSGGDDHEKGNDDGSGGDNQGAETGGMLLVPMPLVMMEVAMMTQIKMIVTMTMMFDDYVVMIMMRTHSKNDEKR